MKFLRKILDRRQRHFSDSGKLKLLRPLYDAIDTFLYTPGKVTQSPPFIRDALDIKRLMAIVVFALLPTVIMALYNTGYQANLILSQSGEIINQGWRIKFLNLLQIGFDPGNLLANLVHGALYFFPVYVVTLAAGGFWEVLFAIVRKHEVAEGFFVTSLLFSLILPPTIPLWQVALGISFGVVLGKEVFGGVGMNIFNPALTGRIFLFFAYPAQITGNAVWIAVDGVSRATPLAEISDPLSQLSVTWLDAFFGLIPGSM